MAMALMLQVITTAIYNNDVIQFSFVQLCSQELQCPTRMVSPKKQKQLLSEC